MAAKRNILCDFFVVMENKIMDYGIFLTAITAMATTFIGVGIADSEWLKSRVAHRSLRFLIGFIVALAIFCPFYLGV